MGISGTGFIKSIFKFSISSWVNFIISIVSVIITTRIFPPDIYGNVTMFNTASNLFMGIACLGLDSSFLRFYNEPPEGYDVKQLMAKCMGLPVLFLSVITIVFVPLFYRNISFWLFNEISLIAIILLCINTFSLVILNFFSISYRISNDARRYTIQSILVQFFTKLFVITAVLFKPEFETVIVFNTIGIFVLSIIYFRIQKKTVLPEKMDWSMKGFSDIFKYAIFSWPTVILIYSNSFVPQMIINNNLGSHELGIYASTGFFVGALGVIQNGFKTYWASFMYGNYKQEQQKIIKIHNYVVLFVVCILSSFIVFQNLLYKLIGSEFQDSRYFFTLVLIYPLFNLICETTAYGITIAKKSHTILLVNSFTAVVNFTLSYVLLKQFGLVGVAVAASISAFIQFFFSTIIGQKYYKSINDIRKTFISIIIIIILSGLNCFFADNYLTELSIVFILVFMVFIIYKKDIDGIYRLAVTAISRYKKLKL